MCFRHFVKVIRKCMKVWLISFGCLFHGSHASQLPWLESAWMATWMGPGPTWDPGAPVHDERTTNWRKNYERKTYVRICSQKPTYHPGKTPLQVSIPRNLLYLNLNRFLFSRVVPGLGAPVGPRMKFERYGLWACANAAELDRMYSQNRMARVSNLRAVWLTNVFLLRSHDYFESALHMNFWFSQWLCPVHWDDSYDCQQVAITWTGILR